MLLPSVKRPAGLLRQITCPHCWEVFPPERSVWISEHADLLGDHRLGRGQQLRFLPSRFTVDGRAVDPKGMPCHQLACPHCHLGIPRALYEMEPLFLSIFGAPASGKSYFLAAMTWELRRVLPLQFHLGFSDSDPAMNRSLTEYEESVFANADGDDLIPLASLIRKTEVQGDLYDSVSYGTQTVSYPRPFLFSLQPQDGHPNAGKSGRFGRVVCLYDNAGESFQPGADSAASPVTRHMARSRALFFVFDPLQEARFRTRCTHPAVKAMTVKATRQEPILQEAAARIRKFAGLKQTEKHNVPLVVVLTKCDIWNHLLNEDLPAEPYLNISGGQALPGDDAQMHAVQTSAVERRSNLCRRLLLQTCPEVVTAAEGFAREVVYVAVSAVGAATQLSQDGAQVSIRPAEAQPHWVTVPITYALAKYAKGLVPRTAPSRRPGDAPAE